MDTGFAPDGVDESYRVIISEDRIRLEKEGTVVRVKLSFKG